MAKRGRKGLYETKVEPYLEQINQKSREGVIESEIAKALGVSLQAFNKYKTEHQELRDALNNGKGADVLQKLINAGIESACGYYRENETITVALDDDGKPAKRQKVTTKTWYPPNASLNRFYVLNYGKEQGFVADPMEAELKKAKAELDRAKYDAENWFVNQTEDTDGEDDGGEDSKKIDKIDE